MANITFSNVKKSFTNIEVIKNFNLEVNDKEFIVLLGPSGCGKSTLLRMIAGLEQISEGKIFIDDILVNDLLPRERNVAMVFQNYALYPHMSVFDNISFGLKRIKVNSSEIKKRVDEVTTLLGIEDYLLRNPKELSGGQQQRVAIARAIIKTPKVFLFDEPLSNLDAKLRNHLRTEISQLHEKLKTTSIYVTHDQLEAMSLADRIVVIKDGYIKQIGNPKEIYLQPSDMFVASFIGTPAINFLQATVSDSGNQWKINSSNNNFYIDKKNYNLSHGLNINLGLRPSNINTVCDNVDINSLEGIVRHIEFFGQEQLISFEKNNNLINALVPFNLKISKGENICFKIDINSLNIFDTKTEKNLYKK